MTLLSVRHLTRYAYARPVGFGDHRILFRPRDSHDQRLLSAEIAITPEPEALDWMHDVFGNIVAIARFGRIRAESLQFETRIRLDHNPLHGPEFTLEERARTHPFSYDPGIAPDLAPTMARHFEDPDDEIGRWARRFQHGTGISDTAALLGTMTVAIKESFKYSRRTDPGTQSPHLTLTTGQGTCRDFALLMMEAVRALGFAARFVTGYIYVPARGEDGNLGGGATHAWCQVYLPGAGWVEFDPTNGIIGNRDLIRVGVARERRQAIPLSGTYRGKRDDPQGMTVQVNVTRQAEGEGDTDGDPADALSPAS